MRCLLAHAVQGTTCPRASNTLCSAPAPAPPAAPTTNGAADACKVVLSYPASPLGAVAGMAAAISVGALQCIGGVSAEGWRG